MDQDAIRKAVRERYGGLADRATADPGLVLIEPADAAVCCDDGCCTPAELTEAEKDFVKGLYAEDEIAGLPPGAIESAAGCGNPTAIAEIVAGETVLDLGSGGGIDCILAARQTGPDGRVIGVDMTQKMVDLARRNAADLGLRNAEFRLGQIEDLPVEWARST